MTQALPLGRWTDDDRSQQGAVGIQFDGRGADDFVTVLCDNHRLVMGVQIVQRQLLRIEQPPHGWQIPRFGRNNRHGSGTARGAQHDPPVSVGSTYSSPNAR